MAIASGVNKVTAFKKESAWGVLAGAAGAQQLRRSSNDLDLDKQTYSSDEVRPEGQTVSHEHGLRSAAGGHDADISPGTFPLLFAAALRRDFAAFATITGLTIAVAAATAPLYTVTRSSGSFITDNVRVGEVYRLSAGAFGTDLNKNFMVVSMTATVLTVLPLNAMTMTAQGGITGASLSQPGKRTYAPKSGHTRDSFTFENWFSDIAQSEVYSGVRVGGFDLNLPPTGISKIKFRLMGKNREQTGSTQHFTSPAAATTSGSCAAVNGAVMLNGIPQAIVTGATFQVDTDLSADPVVGSNVYPDIGQGQIGVQGTLNMFFMDGAARDLFDSGAEVVLAMATCAGQAANADFVNFVLPAVKLSSARKDDSTKQIKQSVAFTAKMGTATTAEQSIMVIQDSAAA